MQHKITVAYSGASGTEQGDPAPNTSQALLQTVNRMQTTTTLTASSPSSLVKGQVTYTATVHPAGRYPARIDEGTITIKDGTTTLCTAAVVRDTVSCSVTYTSVGNHELTATYSGTAGIDTSTSAVVQHPVTYGIRLAYDPAKTVKVGGVMVLKVTLLDANGLIVYGGPSLTVGDLTPSPAPGTAPNGNFKAVQQAGVWIYQLNVKTTGYPAGTYQLHYSPVGDPVQHPALEFTVR